MAYFKEKSMLAMAMKASASSTLLLEAASALSAASWPAWRAVQLASAAMPAALGCGRGRFTHITELCHGLIDIYAWQAQESASAAVHSWVCFVAMLSLHQPGSMD